MHNYGPMDTWSDCQACSDENVEFPPNPFWIRDRTCTVQDGVDWHTFQRKLGHRRCNVAAVLKKIPREKALSWLKKFGPMTIARIRELEDENYTYVWL